MTAAIVAVLVAAVAVLVVMELARRRAATASARRAPGDRFVDAPGFPSPPRPDDEP